MESPNRPSKPRPRHKRPKQKRRRLKQKEGLPRIPVRRNGDKTKESFGQQGVTSERCLKDSCYYC